jgi:hypothetical protein
MATSKLVEEIAHCNCHRFLIDHREVKLSMSTVDLFYLPMVASNIGEPHSSRIAIVYSTHEDDYRFIENVGRNQGFNVKVFRNMDEGVQWLVDPGPGIEVRKEEKGKRKLQPITMTGSCQTPIGNF